LAQIYTGVYVGAAIPHEADVTVTQQGIEEVRNAIEAAGLSPVTSLRLDVTDIEFDAGVMVGGRVGYWLEALDVPFIGLEAEVYGAFPEVSNQDLTVTATGVAAGTPFAVNVTGPISKEDVDVVTIGFNAIARYPHGPIQPYGGVGIGIVNAEIDDDDDTAAGLQLIGGVRGFVTDNVALFGEYKYVMTELEFGDIEMDYNASHVYGGIEYHFGPGVVQK
jgi:opacity protein-like surface antigen